MSGIRNAVKWIGLLVFAAPAAAQDLFPPKDQVPAPKAEYSPFVGDHFPNRPMFGDTHLHTSWSGDAGLVGASIGPDDAYRVSRGEEIRSHQGMRVRLHKPLDWVVIADHAENLGVADFIDRSDPICLANVVCKRWHDMNRSGQGYDAFLEFVRDITTDQINEPRMMEAIWKRVAENADKYYQPGVFSTFTGFEWSPHLAGDNMHRVVIFRDGAEKTTQVNPFSSHNSIDPEDLWRYLEGYEEKTGGQALTLAHNGNLSNGKMFDDVTWTGQPLTKDYAELRMRYEMIYEVTQIIGDGETHPDLSPNDEFADFERMDLGNIMGEVAKTPEMLPREYARAALMRGLAYDKELGANPFKFGLAGSTDAHTGIPTTREDNFFGKAAPYEPAADRWEHVLIKGIVPELSLLVKDTGASGLTGVWARENTREEIFDAFARKEVYATTGSRISVRVFAGWDFDADEVETQDFAREGYARGVPMGGDLSAAPEGEAPRLIIRALRDPDNANLDRVQVVKGWLDADGSLEERIYDVACSDQRAIAERRCATEVGSTVDVAEASYSNSIGDPLLTGFWQDPDFDASQRAFYYVRVIEIPKPRWTAYDAKFFGTEMPEETPMVVQDRAYTSPIWYAPEG
ncbi:DUF3604 domain-containing protein [Pseudophaeobacter leonis]|uniref:DUF3604 domain-containing protein n=1 Tax=Pseudophaeobacter leonis TaxID=1144477 RepID=UPI0009F49EDA|nr:DUF3604 domain-containing protein [Pseudophaeobacter leonis]